MPQPVLNAWSCRTNRCVPFKGANRLRLHAAAAGIPKLLPAFGSIARAFPALSFPLQTMSRSIGIGARRQRLRLNLLRTLPAGGRSAGCDVTQ